MKGRDLYDCPRMLVRAATNERTQRATKPAHRSAMIAFATENCAGIAETMQARLAASGVESRTLEVSVNNTGREIV